MNATPRDIKQSSFYRTVLPFVRDRDVLDVGSIGHDYHGGYKTWNFAVLASEARSIKGFDLLAVEVDAARADGWNIDVGDAESYVASEPVDVVFAGELIEHLSNPGRFFECSLKNLRSGGQLVITTPNAFSFAKLARVIARRTNEPPVNPEHTCYYTPQTLSHLASRFGFRLVDLQYCDLDYAEGYGSRWNRAQLKVNSMLSGAVPRFSQTMVLVFEATDPPAAGD
jgi:SAM-dependent methyltransferase